jgi:hypothetical protein
MMNIKTNGTLGHAIAEYTGLRVLELDVVADPVIEGTYAMQATVFDPETSSGRMLQFLVCDVPLRQVTENDLEECEFTHWPPTSDNVAPTLPVPTCTSPTTPAVQSSAVYRRYLVDILDPRD